MGARPSKAEIDQVERQQQLLKKHNADMAKQMADQEEFNKQQCQTVLEQMIEILLQVAESKIPEIILPNEKTEIFIEKTTYDILDYVNRGGFGEIYRAKVKNTDRIVAIKVLKNIPGLENEIKNEIAVLKITKRIHIDNHPIIEYYGSKTTGEGIFIAMEFALCDLHTFWKNKKFSEIVEHVTIFGTIIIVYVLRALAFLEKLNIIHGDIKPQNLVLVRCRKFFCIKLIDFGAAEKLNTQLTRVSVDAGKVHTLYFASPEFLRSDSNNGASKQLHKRSDAWAAGVMFYFLFCGTFPWTDQLEYRHFCNDRYAKDIIVPGGDGYRMIIELLLRKNPNDRSSATETLLQLKEHPEFRKTVKLLDKNVCPVDDVCHMIVADDVRQDLSKLIATLHL